MMKKAVGAAMGAAVVFLMATQTFAASLTTGLTGTAGVTGSAGAAASSALNTKVNVNTNAVVGANTGTGSGTLNGSLTAQVDSGTMNSSSENAVVDLNGNTDTLISSDADLAAYDNLVTQTRPAITSVTANGDGTVTVDYRQPAKLLGIFPTTITGTMNISANGTSQIAFPWYAFFYAKDTTGIQSAVAAAISADAATNAAADGKTAIQSQAHLINDATTAINSEVIGAVAADTDVNASSATAATVSSSGY